MRDSNTHIAVEQSIAAACAVSTPRTYFELDSAAMKTNDPNLEAVADCLATGALKDRNIRVSGYTDPRGGEQYNKELGKSRAETVAAYFEAKGVKPDKIITKSHGEELSVGKDEEGFAFDRRVSVSLAD